MQKLTIFVDSNRFDISVNEAYMQFFSEKIQEDLSLKEDNATKTLLYAYLRKSYELFALEQKISELSNRIDKHIN